MELIGTGRAADVFAHGEGKVLRRYRTGGPVLQEAALMQYVRGHGYPAPEVYEVHGHEMVMERIEGATMLEHLIKRPWTTGSMAATLARIHDDLSRIAPPAWLEDRIEPARSVAHMDLHPGNIIISKTGPVVIDWSNALAAPTGLDAAATWALLSSGVPPGGAVVQAVVGVLRRSFLSRFLSGLSDLERVEELLSRAIDIRLRDPNTSPQEEAALQDLARDVRL